MRARLDAKNKKIQTIVTTSSELELNPKCLILAVYFEPKKQKKYTLRSVCNYEKFLLEKELRVEKKHKAKKLCSKKLVL